MLKRSWMWAVALTAMFSLAGLISAPAHADGPPTLYPSANERLGFGVVGDITDYDLAPLHAGWYVNWGTARNLIHPEGMDFAHIIRVGDTIYPSLAELRAIAAANPGGLWLVGNEPDCIWQDNVWPEQYAEQYHDIYYTLKAADPTCQVAIGGVVQPTPLRLEWLDRAWDGYRRRYGEDMPVDVWNVHNFILQERSGSWGCDIPPGIDATAGMLYDIQDHDNMDLFRGQILAFRRWMAEKGQRDKPLIVSEYGILFHEGLGYDYERVKRFMLATFDYFMNATDPEIGYPADGNRLVQRWAWYSLDDPSFEQNEYTTWSALYDPFPPYAIRSLGVEFGGYAAARVVPYVDLVPARFLLQLPDELTYGQPADLTAEVVVQNRGNTASDGPVVVELWDGDPSAGGVLVERGQVPAMPRRYAGEETVSFTWSQPITAPHHFVAQVNPAGQVPEWSLANNRRVANLDAWANLRVKDITLSPEHPHLFSGQPLTVEIAAQVENSGTLRLMDVSVCFAGRAPGEDETPLGCVSIPALSAGASTSVEVSWVVSRAGPHHLQVTVDASRHFSETNEADNSAAHTFLVANFGIFWPIIVLHHGPIP